MEVLEYLRAKNSKNLPTCMLTVTTMKSTQKLHLLSTRKWISWKQNIPSGSKLLVFIRIINTKHLYNHQPNMWICCLYDKVVFIHKIRHTEYFGTTKHWSYITDTLGGHCAQVVWLFKDNKHGSYLIYCPYNLMTI